MTAPIGIRSYSWQITVLFLVGCLLLAVGMRCAQWLADYV